MLKLLKENENYQNIPFIFLTEKIDQPLKLSCINSGVSELFEENFNVADFKLRLNYLIGNSPLLKVNGKKKNLPTRYKAPFIKRLFDIVISSAGLTLLRLLKRIFLNHAKLVMVTAHSSFLMVTRFAKKHLKDLISFRKKVILLKSKMTRELPG